MDIGAIESELILIKQPSLFVVVDNMLSAFLERGCLTSGFSRKVRRVKKAKKYDALACFENVLKLKIGLVFWSIESIIQGKVVISR